MLNLLDGGHVKPDPALIEPLYHCVSCGRCQTYCRHDNPVAEILAKGRAQLVAAGLPVPKRFRVVVGGCSAVEPAPPWRPERMDRPALLPSCANLHAPGGGARIERAMAALESFGVILSIPPMERFVGCGFHQWEVGELELAWESWRSFTNLAEGHPDCVTDCGQALWAFDDPPWG